ncbi:MAG: class I SAM-dependent methyltransferase [Ignavibacteria bacterium]
MTNKSSDKLTTTEKIDFDEYAEAYKDTLDKDLQFFGEESGYFAEYKVRTVKETSSKDLKNILEYGCGIGLNLGFFKKYFLSSSIHGCDISQKSMEIASIRNSGVNFFLINDETLAERKEKYDLIFVSCVFHHIAPELRKNSIKQIRQLLKKDGELYIFEHNPHNPVTQKIVRECVWDKDAVLLRMNETRQLMENDGFEVSKKKYTLFFPSALSFLRPVEKFLGWIPFGGQYYVKGIKK